MILQDLVLGIAAVFSIAFLPQAAIIFLIFGCPLFLWSMPPYTQSL